MADPVRKSSAPQIEVRIYRLENHLRSKVTGLVSALEKMEISTEALEKAQMALDKLAEDYPDWVSKHLEQLVMLAARAVDTPEKRRDLFKEINRMAHDMKGQGGTFGYPLVTMFADSLHKFTGEQSGTTDNHVEIIKAHIDAMRAVIKGRIRGSGGEIGKQLVDNLQKAIKKYDPGNAVVE